MFEQLTREDKLEYKEWIDQNGSKCSGTRMKDQDKVYGFGRLITRTGQIEEGFFTNGWLFGKCLIIHSDGSIHTDMKRGFLDSLDKLLQMPMHKYHNPQDLYNKEPETNSNNSLEMWKKIVSPLQMTKVYQSVLEHFPDIAQKFESKIHND